MSEIILGVIITLGIESVVFLSWKLRQYYLTKKPIITTEQFTALI